MKPNINFINIGERTNVTGSAKFKKLILNGDFQEAVNVAKEQIDNGDVAVFYNPLEFDFLFRKFIKKHAPKFCVILECDLWPVMIWSIKRAGLPLIFAQAQYPERGFERDKNFPFVNEKDF